MKQEKQEKVIQLISIGAITYGCLYLYLTVLNIHFLLKTDVLSQTIEFFLNENVVASFFLLTISASLVNWKKSKILSPITLFVSAICILATRSVAAYLGALVAGSLLGVLYQFRSNHRFKYIVNQLVKRKKTVLITLIFLIALFTIGFRFFLSSNSVENRLQWWKGSINLIAKAPFFGHGPGTYEILSKKFDKQKMRSLYAHNFFIQTATETGLFSSLFILIFFIISIFSNQKNSLKFGVAAVCVQNLFDFSLSIPGIYLLCFFYLGLSNPLKTNVQAPEKPFTRQVIFILWLTLSLYTTWKWSIMPAMARQKSIKAQDAYTNKNTVEAENFLREAIKFDPTPALYHYNLSRILISRYVQSKRPSDLKNAFEAASIAAELETESTLYKKHADHLFKLSYE